PALGPYRRTLGELPRREVPHREGEQVRRDWLGHLEEIDHLAFARDLAAERRRGHQRAQVRRHGEPRSRANADARRVLQRRERPRVDRLALAVEIWMLPARRLRRREPLQRGRLGRGRVPDPDRTGGGWELHPEPRPQDAL